MRTSAEEIHLISFDVPYPPNYGGVIDVYYKVKALHDLGVKVHLHCYQYGRLEARELNDICASVDYYKRERFRNPYLGSMPYIVKTRNTRRLLNTLRQDNFPILFEGLHSCYHLANPLLSGRIKMVRMHNIEHHYYANLARVERNWAKKYFFNMESRRLGNFEFILKHASHILAISPNDKAYLEQKFKDVSYIPAFHPNKRVESLEGRGDFILYHGNLEVGENDEAAVFLVLEVFSRLSHQCIIAGNNPSARLKQLVKRYHHIQLQDNITIGSLHKLIKIAQVNVLPTFQSTGIKLKLLNALFLGRHCVVNQPMVANTGLGSLCTTTTNSDEMVMSLDRLFHKPFTAQDIQKRVDFFERDFNNRESALKILNLMRETNAIVKS
jgi:glycosyltransferase involved in cell wall biosynthesis